MLRRLMRTRARLPSAMPSPATGGAHADAGGSERAAAGGSGGGGNGGNGGGGGGGSGGGDSVGGGGLSASGSARSGADGADARAARARGELEQALVCVLLFNTLYLYYCDARLLVLFIRASQILRLLYFPYEPPRVQRGTALLLLLSNVPVLLIHAAIAADGEPGEMLLINFVGPEPHPLAKMFYVDAVTVTLQAVLASVSAGDGVIVSSMPALCAAPPPPPAATLPARAAAAAAAADPAADPAAADGPPANTDAVPLLPEAHGDIEAPRSGARNVEAAG